MRIQAVTGDLPAVVVGPPLLRLSEQPPPTPPSIAVTPAAVSGGDAGATADRRPAPAPKSHFDPPLIAQRAVLGLPVGAMIADLARESGVSYAAAAAAVDREMPRGDLG